MNPRDFRDEPSLKEQKIIKLSTPKAQHPAGPSLMKTYNFLHVHLRTDFAIHELWSSPRYWYNPRHIPGYNHQPTGVLISCSTWLRCSKWRPNLLRSRALRPGLARPAPVKTKGRTPRPRDWTQTGTAIGKYSGQGEIRPENAQFFLEKSTWLEGEMLKVIQKQIQPTKTYTKIGKPTQTAHPRPRIVVYQVPPQKSCSSILLNMVTWI